MTVFLTVLAVLWFTQRAWVVIRREYVPYVERRLQERAQGLPRGALAERWATPGNGMDEDTWIRVLKHVNKATRLERRQLLRQRDTA